MDVDLNRTRREQAEAIQHTGSYTQNTAERPADVTMASVADRMVGTFLEDPDDEEKAPGSHQGILASGAGKG